MPPTTEDTPGVGVARDDASVVHAGFSTPPSRSAARRFLGRAWGIIPEVLVELAASAEHDTDPAARAPRAAVSTVQPGAQAQGSVAIVPLRGVISPCGSFIARLFGMSSGLEGFREDFREALNDDSVAAIILDIDSPGGLIDMVPETAAELLAARGKKPIVAVANTLAASAAYWIASQADEVIVTPSGQVGSIGVFTIHEDVSKLEQMMGISTTIISAGRFKTEGNPYEPLSKQGAQAMQGNVDELYAMFTGAIAKARGIPIQAVQAGYGEGRCILAARALELGMVDRVETLEQTAIRLGATLPSDEEDDGEQMPDDQEMAPDDDAPPEPETAAEVTTTNPVMVDYLTPQGPVDYLSAEGLRAASLAARREPPHAGGRL